MTRRMALALAGALTAFILVFLAGVIFTVRWSTSVQAMAPQAAPSIAGPSLPPSQLTAEQATEIAQRIAPNSRLVLPPELVDLRGTVAYEVTLDRGIVYVDADNGQVLHTTLGTIQDPRARGEREHEDEHEDEHEHEEEDEH